MLYAKENKAGAWDAWGPMTNTRILLEGVLVHMITLAALLSVGVMSMLALGMLP